MPDVTTAATTAAKVQPVPSLGRIVHYQLSAQDAEAINRRRTTGFQIAERVKATVLGSMPTESGSVPVTASLWPLGAQAHIGNEAHEGDLCPALIVKCWGTTPTSAVNLQVFLDGNDVFWATSRTVGEQPGTFAWPPRV